MFLWIALSGCAGVDGVSEVAEAPASPKDSNALGAVMQPRRVLDASSGSPAKPASQCPVGLIAAPSWPGEYPSPVVDVTRSIDVEARVHPCDAEATVTCALQAGVYHPWAGEASSFVTVRPVERFQASKPVRVGKFQLQAGDQVAMTQEIGEGFCAWQLNGETVQAECPPRMPALTPLGAPENEPVQLMRISCPEAARATASEGTAGSGEPQAWVVVDDALMAEPGVREGTFVEYGKVGPGSGRAPH